MVCRLKKDQLQSISELLGLSTTGSNDELAESVVNFLLEPIDQGKSIPETKMPTRLEVKASSRTRAASTRKMTNLAVSRVSRCQC
jgi:hypothetical protein